MEGDIAIHCIYSTTLNIQSAETDNKDGSLSEQKRETINEQSIMVSALMHGPT